MSDTLLPSFPISIIKQHRSIGIVAPRRCGKTALSSEILATAEDFSQRGDVVTIDCAGNNSWEEELSDTLANCYRLTTVIVDNLSTVTNRTLGVAILNTEYCNCNLMVLAQSLRSLDDDWVSYFDYIFLSNCSDSELHYLWLLFLAEELTFDDFKTVVKRYSAGRGWVVLNLRKDRQFSTSLYWTTFFHYEPKDESSSDTEEPEEDKTEGPKDLADNVIAKKIEESLSPKPSENEESYLSTIWRWITWQ